MLVARNRDKKLEEILKQRTEFSFYGAENTIGTYHKNVI